MRLRATILAAAVLATLSSCAVTGTVGREDLLAKSTVSQRFDNFGTPPGQSVRSYTTIDGAQHRFAGKAWVERDSVVFEGDHERRRVALADIASVVAEETDAGRTIFLALGVAAIAFGVWFLNAVSHID